MRLTLRFLRRNAVAYVLIALAPLTAYSQNAPAHETHGIVVAYMDRSVKPGDDFYHYANGNWIKRTDRAGLKLDLVDTANLKLPGL